MSWIKIKETAHTIEMDLSARNESIDIDFELAVKRYIDEIVATYPAPYTLFVTGGVDSQATIQAWRKSGHDFNIVSVRYENDYNEHDLTTLKEFEERFDVEVKYLDFNLTDFLENRLEEYVVKYKCASPQICTHMAISELVPEGTIIFSGTAPSIHRMEFTSDCLPLYTYRDLARPNMIPFFLMDDKDVAGAFLREGIKIEKAYAGIGVQMYQVKCDLYNTVGLEVIPQEKKFNGFEKVKLYYETRQELVNRWDRMKWSDMPAKWVFDIAFRYKWYDVIGKSKHLEIRS